MGASILNEFIGKKFNKNQINFKKFGVATHSKNFIKEIFFHKDILEYTLYYCMNLTPNLKNSRWSF